MQLKRKISLAVGAGVLAVGSVIVGRASAKTTPPPANLYVQVVPGTGGCRQLAGGATFTVANLFSTSSSGNQAAIITNGGNSRPLFSDNTCGTPVYFNP